MVAPDRVREATAGGGLARPILAYVGIVFAGAWVRYGIDDFTQQGDLIRAPFVAAATVLGAGPGPLATLVALFIPATVLTVELVGRLDFRSRTARSFIGAASWAGWGVFLAVSLSALSRVVLLPDLLAAHLALFAAGGAGFTLLDPDGARRRAGRVLIVLAVAVAMLVVLGSIVMAGRWGSVA